MKRARLERWDTHATHQWKLIPNDESITSRFPDGVPIPSGFTNSTCDFDREIDARRFAKKKGITIVETEAAS